MSDKHELDVETKLQEARHADEWRNRYASERNLDPRTLKPIPELSRGERPGSLAATL